MFRRTKKVGAASGPIEDFWRWWPTVSKRFEEAIETGDYGSLIQELSRRVKAVDPGLEWEFSPGLQSRHALCVTSAGDPALRSTSKRWQLAAPPPSDTWEYHSSRVPKSDALQQRLSIGGHTLDLLATRFTVALDEDRAVVDLQVHHPEFVRMQEDTRYQVMFLVLDWLLGEDSVERWVGALEATADVTPGVLDGPALAEVIEAMRTKPPSPGWVILEAVGPRGRRVVAVAERPLKRADYPLFDLHGAISCPFKEQTADRLPAAPALDQLRRFEDQLREHFDAVCAFPVVVTSWGVRALHLYCDSETSTRAHVDAFVSDFRDYSIVWDLDPAWTAMGPYR